MSAHSCTVLSIYPLSRMFRDEIGQQRMMGVEFLNLGSLRKLPLIQLVRHLRRVRSDELVVALEDPSSKSLLPILKTLAAFTCANQLFVLDSSLKKQQFGRLQVIPSLVSFCAAVLVGQMALIRARRTLNRLRSNPPQTARRKGVSPALYLNANLWFGVKAGGSVGHISGVANGLMRSGSDLVFASAGGRLLVEPQAELVELEGPRAYGTPFETNYYRFSFDVVKQLAATLSGTDFAFIYQRLSLCNFSGILLSRRYHVPLIVEYNGSEVWVARNWGKPLRYEKLALMAEDVTLKHAHLIVTVSGVLRDELIERGVDPKRIVAYPNCIDPKMFDPAQYGTSDRSRLLDSLGVPDSAVVATFVGTFGQWHGADILAETIRLLSRAKRDWLVRSKLHFLLVGDGQKMAEVLDILSDPACEGFYTLAGLVPQNEAPRYLAASDILLSPHVPNPDGSRFFGSPTKLFEYMAMAKPIVASALDQIADVLVNGVPVANYGEEASLAVADEPALLVEPGNPESLARGIRLAVNNPVAGRRLGENARRIVLQNYTWDHHVAAILRGLGDIWDAD